MTTPSPITRLRLRRFTAFEDLDIEFSPGVNVLVGRNGTGKTHILKAIYAVCTGSSNGSPIAEKLVRVFSPYEDRIGRLVNRRVGRARAVLEVERGRESARVEFSTVMEHPTKARESVSSRWKREPARFVYIPVKEMLAHAPGFRSLYATRSIGFEETYADLLDRAYLPLLRGPVTKGRKRLLAVVERAIEGKVHTEGETFFLKNESGNLEFSLLAEGLRKMALLWVLIQNGTFDEGNVVFWDEPEANLNPTLLGCVVEILLELARSGVQVFLATHNYVVLKEFDLRSSEGDAIAYHGLFRDPKSGAVRAGRFDHYLDLTPNAIADTYLDLFEREMTRAAR